MKVVYNSRTKPADISAITEKFPELDFVVTYGPDDVARELGDAEIMFISNRVYVEDMVAAVNANEVVWSPWPGRCCVGGPPSSPREPMMPDRAQNAA